MRYLYRHTTDRVGGINSASLSTWTGAPISSAEGFEVLCSYNWVNTDHPAILVPGGAPVWTRPKLPQTVNKDHGVFYKDANVAKNPAQPYEPMVRAIAATSGTLANLGNVDVIVNRTALLQLFKFAKGSSAKNFKIDVNLVNNTLFVCGRQRKNREDVTSPNSRAAPSWGHAFEEAFTKYGPGAEGSTSCQRAIRYRFGNLTFLVRHEVDAAYASTAGSARGNGTNAASDDFKERHVMWANSFRGNGRAICTEVRLGGQETSPSDLIELKARPNMPVYMAIPQMWFGRTPHLLKGVHSKGRFTNVDHTACVPEYKKWEERNQEALQKLAAMFVELRRLAAANGKSLVCIVRRDDKQMMEVWTPTFSRLPIPVDLAKIYWRLGPTNDPRYRNHPGQPQRQPQRQSQGQSQGDYHRGPPRGPPSGHPRGPPSGHPRGPPSSHPRGPPRGPSNGPPSGPTGYPPRNYSGYPPRGPAGHPPTGPPGYPPTGAPGHPSRGYSGFPPGPPPGSVPGPAPGTSPGVPPRKRNRH
ncbi:hypothetical protein CPLU01_07620 [Colletotrichum plurivorum]|uniref:Uncharacterized protein n=1 Tax=Colletotrichum plurivorum TaxID=2175906 RepID=A0A8H6KET2_9PEZI|nr:hypothetical protein CPLU01_07620 [Colletotrichum plurivorum]